MDLAGYKKRILAEVNKHWRRIQKEEGSKALGALKPHLEIREFMSLEDKYRTELVGINQTPPFPALPTSDEIAALEQAIRAARDAEVQGTVEARGIEGDIAARQTLVIDARVNGKLAAHARLRTMCSEARDALLDIHTALAAGDENAAEQRFNDFDRTCYTL